MKTRGLLTNIAMVTAISSAFFSFDVFVSAAPTAAGAGAGASPSASASASAGTDEMVTLRDNIVGQLTTADPDKAVDEAVALIGPDGSFTDINYTPDPITNYPFKHIGRLHDMAVAWGCPNSRRYQSAPLKAEILKTYNYWVAHDIQHRNWWFNDIGVPDSLSETMLILQKHGALPSDNFHKAIAIINRALPNQKGVSAANLVWEAYATRNEGVLYYFGPSVMDGQKPDATALVKQSFQRIDSTIKFTKSDGINVDYCFHAHGPVPYNGGYGAAWLDDTSRIAASAAGTDYGFAPDKLKLIIDYVLGGDQYMSRGTHYDLVTIGRAWTREEPDSADHLRASVAYLMSVDPDYRDAELKTLKARLDEAFARKSADPANTAVGNRAYYTADYMVQQRADYLLSVKTVSNRTSLPEAMNGENLLGGYGFSGINLLYVTGNEYDRIEPVWDWYRLPGTTSERAADGTGGRYDLKPASNKRAPKAIAGGASDGSVGASAFQYNQYNITANKSYFLFDRGEVAMGNSIAQEKPHFSGDVVGTNITQTLLDGAVVYRAAGGQATTLGDDQTITPKGLQWVNHASVGYFFLEPVDNATIRDLSHTGAWHAINLVSKPADKVTKRVFDLDLSHGEKPTDASYVYAIIPGITADQMDAFLAAKPFTILQNDAVAQALTDNTAKITEVNFYGPGDVTLWPAANSPSGEKPAGEKPSNGKPGVTLTLTDVSSSASVLLRQESGKLTISVASPEHRSGPLALQISGHYAMDKPGDATTENAENKPGDKVGGTAEWNAADGRSTLTFDLPGGMTAGSTVTETFTAVP